MGLRERLLDKAAADQLDKADPGALRDYYQSVVDSVGSVIYTVNRDLRITGVNKGWDDFALANGGPHLTSEHVLGSHLLDQLKGTPLQRWRTVCQQLLNGELPRYLDEIASAEPFSWRHYSLRATPLRDGRGQIQGITFVATNITQLKKAENEMFQRLVEIRGLRQVAQTAGSWVDRRSVYRQITSDIAHLFGADKCVIFLWSEQTGNLQAREPAFGLAGRKLAELSLDMGHPADSDSLWLDLEQRDYILLNEGDHAPADVVETSSQVDRLAAMLGILRVSGRIHGAILVAGRDRPFNDNDGQLLALFAVPTALSIENAELNRRLLDRTEQLASAQHQLEKVDEAKQAIRMPLTVMRGYLELLDDGTLGTVPEPHIQPLKMLLEQTRTITDLFSEIPAHLKAHAGDRCEPICLADLVRLVLDRRLPAVKKGNLSLQVQLPTAQDEESIMLGDLSALHQAFDTLVDNAIRLSPVGGSLHISLESFNGVLHFKLAEPQVNIPLQQQLDIGQLGGGLDPSGPIFLAETKRIVEEHGGQIWVESSADNGTIFHIVLPEMNP